MEYWYLKLHPNHRLYQASYSDGKQIKTIAIRFTNEDKTVKKVCVTCMDIIRDWKHACTGLEQGYEIVDGKRFASLPTGNSAEPGNLTGHRKPTT